MIHHTRTLISDDADWWDHFERLGLLKLVGTESAEDSRERDAFFGHVSNTLYGFLVGFAPSLSHEDYLDIIQETLLDVFLRPPINLRQGALKAYFKQIARRKSFRFKKRENGRKARESTFADLFLDEDEPGLDANQSAEEWTRLMEAICSLKSIDQQIITLYYFEKIKTKQIANILEKNVDTIDSRRQRAVVRLAKSLRQIQKANKLML